MITGLPSYRPPVVEPVRCVCRRFYRVYVGADDYESSLAEREALKVGAVFVDARRSPWFVCECGQSLDFAPEASMMIQ